jgi:tetratricopeptide (TPR) repeat protein
MGRFNGKNYDTAEVVWGKAQSLYPSNPYLVSYYRVLSNVYIQQAFADAKANNLGNALYWFDRASKIFPQDPEIWYNLGGVAFSLKDYARARAAFERCLQLNPNHQNAKNGLANCPMVAAAPVQPVAVPGQQPATQVPPPPNGGAPNGKR